MGDDHDTPSSGRVLLVDDSVDVRRLVGFHLRSTGAQVVEAENGRAACDLAYAAQGRRADFDLILLDMEMPELDGHAAATLLRLQGYAGPIVALTAADDAGERARCLADGCSDYLRKPVDRDALLELVTRHSAGRPRPPAVDHHGRETAANDPAMAAFLEQFLKTLAGYADRLEDELRRDAIEPLAQTIHQIKGAAGMYGFGRLYEVAATAERAAKSVAAAAHPADAAARLRDEVDSIVRAIRSACGPERHTREVGVARG